MDSLDTQIALLLNGQPLHRDIPVVCDYTPNDQIGSTAPVFICTVYMSCDICFTCSQNCDQLSDRMSII